METEVLACRLRGADTRATARLCTATKPSEASMPSSKRSARQSSRIRRAAASGRLAAVLPSCPMLTNLDRGETAIARRVSRLAAVALAGDKWY